MLDRQAKKLSKYQNPTQENKHNSTANELRNLYVNPNFHYSIL